MSLCLKADMLVLTYNAIYSPAHKLKSSETETLLIDCYHLLLRLHSYRALSRAACERERSDVTEILANVLCTKSGFPMNKIVKQTLET